MSAITAFSVEFALTDRSGDVGTGYVGANRRTQIGDIVGPATITGFTNKTVSSRGIAMAHNMRWNRVDFNDPDGRNGNYQIWVDLVVDDGRVRQRYQLSEQGSLIFEVDGTDYVLPLTHDSYSHVLVDDASNYGILTIGVTSHDVDGPLKTLFEALMQA